MARPKKHSDEARTERLNLRYTLAEIETIKQRAAQSGLRPHDYARRVSLGDPVRSPARKSIDPALVVALNRIGNNVNQLARSSHRGSDFVRHWEAVSEQLVAVLHQAAKEVSE